ncbi:MAG: SIS domain-containing protein [Gammaproteobacteria bacterium]|nr:SIS domain-containing protein [Gammaproteobacteria bacterium]
MDPIERVKYRFEQNAQLSLRAAASQAAPIAAAAEAIVGSLMGGGKVLSCGNGCSAADADYFTAQMQNRFDRQRPGLPAISLCGDATLLTAIAADEGFEHVFAKQVNALGHPGDILLTLCAGGSAPNIRFAIRQARERQMKVVSLAGGGDHDAPGDNDCDIEIATPSDDVTRILENHRSVVHCLCDLIDLQLMGG